MFGRRRRHISANTRIVFVAVPRTVTSLDYTVKLTGDTANDVINRAVQVYAYVEDLAAKGQLVFIEAPSTGERVRFVLVE